MGFIDRVWAAYRRGAPFGVLACALGLAVLTTDELFVSPAMNSAVMLAATGNPAGLQSEPGHPRVFCLVPPGARLEPIAQYLTPAMQRRWSWWINPEATAESGQWWVAVLGSSDDITLHRMSAQLRPHMDGPLCAAPERLRFASSGRGEDGGLRFQVRAVPP